MRKGFAFAVAAMASLLAPVAASAKPASRMVTVILDKLTFGAVPANLRVGDTVLWINRDLFQHSATAPGHFDVDLPTGARRQMVLWKAGIFPFLCKYHPGMKGVLKVGQ